jgi:hypothetical protein
MKLDEQLERRLDDQAGRARELLGLPARPDADLDLRDVRALIDALRERLPAPELTAGGPIEEHTAALERLRHRF